MAEKEYEIQKEVQQKLFARQDLKYRDFHSRLMPTIDKERVIGVRTPELRKYAKEFGKSEQVQEFLDILPHYYYEENNLHGFILEGIKDYEQCVSEINRFLPYVDNWATCDLMRPKVFKKHLPELLEQIKAWMQDSKTYTIRFGIEMLMTFYLDQEFDRRYLDMVAQIRSEEYYVNMMIAWYFATALAKQYEATVPFLEHQTLEDWTHNKTIQKAVESFRITPEQKAYLRTLKVYKNQE